MNTNYTFFLSATETVLAIITTCHKKNKIVTVSAVTTFFDKEKRGYSIENTCNTSIDSSCIGYSVVF